MTARRNSITSSASRLRVSSGSGIPRPQAGARDSRVGNPGESGKLATQISPMKLLQMSTVRGATQSTFNPFTGETTSQPQRPPSRHSNVGGQLARGTSCESTKENMAPPDAEEYETQRKRIEELRAELATLRYSMNNQAQERDLEKLQHEAELREAQRRAEEDFKARQVAETERSRVQRQLDAAQAELAAMRTAMAEDKAALEKKLREATEMARRLEERVEDLEVEKSDGERAAAKQIRDLQDELAARARLAEEAEQEQARKEEATRQLADQLSQKEAVIDQQQAEILRLRARTGDAETMAIVRRELADQVAHIRQLEATNREQLAELKHLRQVSRAVEVVEEEKRSLQRRLDAAAQLEAELEEARLQRRRLEDERLEWTSYLKTTAAAAGTDGGDLEFSSPADLARALVAERLNSASLLERLGALQPAIAERDGVIRSLEEDKARLASQLAQMKQTGAGASSAAADRARQRLERQRQLAVKEAEYLRAQLKTFDVEDATFQPENFDQARVQRINELETLVDQYRVEQLQLHEQLTALESSSASTRGEGSVPAPGDAVSKKRPAADDENGVVDGASTQFGQLSRKNRALQDSLAALQAKHRLVVAELEATRAQLSALQTTSKTRILSLRSNPTDDYARVKQATIDELRTAYEELLATTLGKSPAAMVPESTLAVARRETEAARAETASAKKSAQRLKEVWAAKSAEFKAAVDSMLGWSVAFLPNGRMRVESAFYPSLTDEHERSIVFDGEQGTMKVAGGPRSAFAARIEDQIQFWVREKGCIPGFLAALTLEFYDEWSRREGGDQTERLPS